MKRRPLGSTGLQVTEISLGGNRIGGKPAQPDEHWIRLIQRSLELGINFFDTADLYAEGWSEELLGRALEGREALICTKVGSISLQVGYDKNLSETYLVNAAENSLRRLRREAIDLLLIHSPSLDEVQASTAVETVKGLVQRGLARHWGYSLPHTLEEGFWAIEQGAEVLQVEYNLMQPEPEQALFPLAQQRGVGIMARLPLFRGLLSGKYSPAPDAPRPEKRNLPPGDALDELVRRADLFRFLERPGQTMAQAAIRYSLAHPAVSCSIPGARNLEQLEANLAAVNGHLTADELARVREVQESWA
jgi:aryl-alcohol dehydrogenase-like predicted oxidoreductase